METDEDVAQLAEDTQVDRKCALRPVVATRYPLAQSAAGSRRLYQQIWALQDVFSNPPSLDSHGTWVRKTRAARITAA